MWTVETLIISSSTGIGYIYLHIKLHGSVHKTWLMSVFKIAPLSWLLLIHSQLGEWGVRLEQYGGFTDKNNQAPRDRLTERVRKRHITSIQSPWDLELRSGWTAASRFVM